MPLCIAMAKRTGGDHLGVEQSVAAEQAVEIAAVAISPIHHRRNTYSSPHPNGLNLLVRSAFLDCLICCHLLGFSLILDCQCYSPCYKNFM
jgi:hypothetical protein